MFRTKWIILGLTGAAIALAIGMSNYISARPDLAEGAAIYAEACASCHGGKLEGQPDWKSAGPDGRLPAPPHDESGHTWHHSDRLLMEIVRRGTSAVVGGGYQSNMPAFGQSYTDDELRNVLAWIKSQWPNRQREYQAEATARDGASD